MIDVTDATFESEVLDRSVDVPVVVDLWAPWCGPCRTLGPTIEKAVEDTDGQVLLVKVNVDENPAVSQAFQVQSIPAVYAIKDRKVVDGFIGAQGATEVTAFVQGLLAEREPTEVELLVAAGDEASLRQALELEPDNEDAIVTLAELLIADEKADEAVDLLARIPETAETRRVAALARTGFMLEEDEIVAQLDSLLDGVKDPDVRQRFVDLLELLGADDPRTADYRKKMTARLY
jgi:putative thioredoxin